jgi:nucleoside 2-deoxyribosyltransferase
MKPRLIYIAGPFRSDSRWQEEQNIRAAEALGYEIALLGAYPVIPHSNTRGYFSDAQPGEFFLDGTLELMRRCDAVIFLPNWQDSTGAIGEHDEAERLGLPVFGCASGDGLRGLAIWLLARGEA